MPSSPISLEQLRDYAYCSMLFYWKHVMSLSGAGDNPGEEGMPLTTLELPGEVIRQAWRVFAGRPDGGDDTAGDGSETTELQEAAMMVWRTWLAHSGADTDDVLKGLMGYAGALTKILEAFESGKVRKRDGSRYKEPRMSRKFKDMARSSGLPSLASELDKKLIPTLGSVPAKHPLFGAYTVADAFTESLRMAERLSRPGEAPARAAILAVEEPVSVRVGEWALPAVADMLVVDDPEGDPPSVTVEVHDYSPDGPPLARMVGRDLRVIAGLHMEPLPGGGTVFGEVTGVTYRHIPSGWTHFRRRAAGGRLTAVLESALRGIREGIYLPMFLIDLHRCDPCAMREPCFNPGGIDALEALSPGLTDRTEAVAESVRSVAGSLSAGERKFLTRTLKSLTRQLDEHGGKTGDLPAAVHVLERKLEPTVDGTE